MVFSYKINMAHILVIDDEINHLKTIQRILLRTKVEVDIADDTDKVLSMIKTVNYDLVLLDIIMPKINGLELCEIIHRINPGLPIIIMTALMDDDIILKAFEKGAEDFIRKPIQRYELMLRIESILNQKRREEKLLELYKQLQDELEMASVVQKCILPSGFKVYDDSLFSYYSSADSYVTGQLFNYFEFNKSTGVIYSINTDYSGIQGAIVISAMNSLFRNKLFTDIFQHNELSEAMKIFIKKAVSFIPDCSLQFMVGIYSTEDSSLNYSISGKANILKYSFLTKRSEMMTAEDDIENINLQNTENSIEIKYGKTILENDEALIFLSPNIELERYNTQHIGNQSCIRKTIDGSEFSNPFTLPYEISDLLKNDNCVKGDLSILSMTKGIRNYSNSFIVKHENNNITMQPSMNGANFNFEEQIIDVLKALLSGRADVKIAYVSIWKDNGKLELDVSFRTVQNILDDRLKSDLNTKLSEHKTGFSLSRINIFSIEDMHRVRIVLDAI